VSADVLPILREAFKDPVAGCRGLVAHNIGRRTDASQGAIPFRAGALRIFHAHGLRRAPARLNIMGLNSRRLFAPATKQLFVNERS
jgi:hypothetical protein